MIYWNPDPVAFTIPFFNLPIYIYGLCFVSGFMLGYFLLIKLMQSIKISGAPGLVDQMTWFVVAGTLIGARLGHVFFYDWERYKNNLLLILNTREGGLASHGGTIGVLIALGLYQVFIFRKKTGKSFLELLDMVVIPTALVAFFIRLGNFFNQEIIGTPSDLPWAVVFGSPADHALAVARHPAQMYEGLFYLLTFFALLHLWYRTKSKLYPGLLTGIFFVAIFGSRFLIEFVKAPQDAMFDQSFLQAGQTLSIPFIIGGLLLIYLSRRKGLIINKF